MKFSLRPQQIGRLNAVLDYIEYHLDESLSLETLSKTAAMSPFHFLRLFKSHLGETPNSYIQRIRMEKAAFLLLSRQDDTILSIALDCGYSSAPPFDRMFKSHFGMTPGEWKKGGWKKSRIGQAAGNSGQASSHVVVYYDDGEKRRCWRMMDASGNAVKVFVRELPERQVVYIRHRGEYAGNEELFADLFQQLCRWALPRGLMDLPEAKFLILYHDDPGLTEGERLKLSVCLTVPEGTPVEGELGSLSVPGGLYASGLFRLTSGGYTQAWNLMTGVWLPASGYTHDNRPAYELYPEAIPKAGSGLRLSKSPFPSARPETSSS